MREERRQTGAEIADEEREALQRKIDALMRQPPKDLPSIVVVGDDDVFGITPAKA